MALSFLMIWQLCLGALFLHVALRIARIVYDVFFGPLSHIPGPKLAAATRLVASRHVVKGDVQQWYFKLHEQYGPVVRPSPDEVSFSTGEVWKQIYGHRPGAVPARVNMPKDPMFYHPPETNKPTGLAPAADEVHHRQRKIFNSAFSERALMRQEPILRRYVEQLLSNLSDIATGKGKTDMVKNYNFATFDIMADLTFGEPLGCLQNSEYAPWISNVFANLKVITIATETRYYPWARKLINRMRPKKLLKGRDEHRQSSINLVNKRLASKESRPDIWGIVLEANAEKAEEQKLKLEEMHSNSMLFMLAGTETSATLLSAVTYYLLRDMTKLSLLTEEIRSSFSSVVDINLTKLSQLTYLNACLHEALRIHPPVPIGLPRIVPAGGMRMAGYFIPEKTRVSVHQYSTYHSTKNFARAEEFIPERWLPDPPEEFAHDDLSSVHPFSVGPRNCLGVNLAWFEMRYILASVIYSYDMSLCEESNSWNRQKVFFMWEKGPLMVTLKPRGGP